MSARESDAGKEGKKRLHPRDTGGTLRQGGHGELCGRRGSASAARLPSYDGKLWVEIWLPFFERSPTTCLLGFDLNTGRRSVKSTRDASLDPSLRPPCSLALSDPQAQPSSQPALTTVASGSSLCPETSQPGSGSRVEHTLSRRLPSGI